MQSRLLAVGNDANRFLNARNFTSQKNGRNDIGPRKPDRLFAGEIVDTDVLSCAVVDRANRQDVVIGPNQCEKPEVRPQLAVKATFKRDLRKKLSNLFSRLRKGYVLGCDHTPVVQ